MKSDKLLPHSIEETPEYQLAWDVYEQTTSQTPYIRRQIIARRSVASLSFKQAEHLFTTQSELTTIEGDGLRVNLFVSGCQFRCVNCFNESSQKFGYGERYSKKHEKALFDKLSLPFVDGVTFVGGEPFQSAAHLIEICRKIKDEHPDKTIWSYTGYIIELLLMLDDDDPKREFLNYIDVLIDGQYIDEERDESDLKVYRGSSNQRLIDVKKTLETNNTTLHEMESYK